MRIDCVWFKGVRFDVSHESPDENGEYRANTIVHDDVPYGSQPCLSSEQAYEDLLDQLRKQCDGDQVRPCFDRQWI